MLPTDDEQKKELVRSKLLEEWRAKNQKADEDMASAETGRAWLEGANALGGAFTALGNAKRETPITYANAFKSGDAPKVQSEVNPEQKWDNSNLSRLGQGLVDNAKSKKDAAFNDIDRTERLRKADYDNQKESDADALAGKYRDSKSDESQLARAYLSKLSPEAAKDPRFNNLTAEQVYKLSPGLMEVRKLESSEREQRLEGSRKARLETDKAAKEAEKDDFDHTSKLRKEYNDHDVTKDTREVETASERAEALYAESAQYAKSADPAEKAKAAKNDIALVYAFAKSIDPRSVVKEAEYKVYATNPALQNQINSYIQTAKDGTLTNIDRDALINSIRTASKVQFERQKKVDDYYSGLASDYKLNSGRVVRQAGGPSAPGGGGGGDSGKKVQHGSDLP